MKRSNLIFIALFTFIAVITIIYRQKRFNNNCCFFDNLNVIGEVENKVYQTKEGYFFYLRYNGNLTKFHFN
jgi:hypothetical protein